MIKVLMMEVICKLEIIGQLTDDQTVNHYQSIAMVAMKNIRNVLEE